MSCAWLSLGGNLGDRLAQLQFAVSGLRAAFGIAVSAQSGIYVSAPWGGVEQSDFYNAALRLETSLAPLDLLRCCQRIEAAAGRKRGLRWGPRLLDIDILLYDALRLELPELILPHPRIWQRRFVLLPLAEIADQPDMEIPGQGRLDRLIRDCPDRLKVELLIPAGEW